LGREVDIQEVENKIKKHFKEVFGLSWTEQG
jgi:hypothetical protein